MRKWKRSSERRRVSRARGGRVDRGATRDSGLPGMVGGGAGVGRGRRTVAETSDEIPYSSSLTLSLIYKRQRSSTASAPGSGSWCRERNGGDGGRGDFRRHQIPVPRAGRSHRPAPVSSAARATRRFCSESDESLLAIAREELRRILGLTARADFSHRSRAGRDRWRNTPWGTASGMQEIKARAAAIPGLHLAGNAYDGIGIPDCIRTGRSAAKASIDSAAS